LGEALFLKVNVKLFDNKIVMSELNKIYELTDTNPIWRILISDTDTLVLERRNTDAKEVFFNAYKLANGEVLWENFQPEEKFWIGIEKIYKDVIYFHKFAKPDMPGHRGVFAYDLPGKKKLWENSSSSFAFILDDKVFAFRDDISGAKLDAFDYRTGEMRGQPIEEIARIDELQKLSQLKEDFSDYVFPEKFYGDEPEAAEIENALKEALKENKLKGTVEFGIRGNLLFLSFHVVEDNSLMRNIFTAYDLKRNEIIFEDVLNSSIDLFVAETFFAYKDFLFLLKGKNILEVYKITGE
jgi:hypothetical protein